MDAADVMTRAIARARPDMPPGDAIRASRQARAGRADFTGADILRIAADCAAARQPVALAIVIEASGPTSARAGAKALFSGAGGTVSRRPSGDVARIGPGAEPLRAAAR